MILLRDRRPLMSLAVCLIMIISTLHLFLQEQQTGLYESTPYRTPNGLFNSGQTNSTVSSFSISSSHQSSFEENSVSAVSDYNKLIDLNDFDFTIDRKVCTKNELHAPLIVILVHSAPENFAKRRAIRETWGRKDDRSLLIFLFGAVSNATLNNQLIEENAIHDDIVQGNFVDSYRNMTYKHLMGFKWFQYNCKKTNFVLKTDDDVLVNSPFLYESLEKFFSNPSVNSTIIESQQSSLKLVANQLILCDKIVNSIVKRSFRSKWRVSYEEYNQKLYPPYCPGFGIIYSADVIEQLYNKAQTSRYFWIDDVYVTGILSSELNIPITTGKDLFLKPKETLDVLSNDIDQAKKLKLKFLFAKPDLTASEIRKLWNVFMDTRVN